VDGDRREPDYRFSLANERTLLAWVRTALALDAAGLGVRAGGPIPAHAAPRVLAAALAAISVAILALLSADWLG
jgi:putative membrane protein